MKHFLDTQDWTRPALDAVLAQAAAFKRHPAGDQLKGRSIALVFFNPSLRTRASMQIGIHELGGNPVILEPGSTSWKRCHQPGLLASSASWTKPSASASVTP